MSERNHSRRWLRIATLTAAIAAILFVATGASLWHLDGADSAATCPICHITHLAPGPPAPMATLVIPLLAAPAKFRETCVSHVAPIGLDSPPRAPPV